MKSEFRNNGARQKQIITIIAFTPSFPAHSSLMYTGHLLTYQITAFN